MQIMLTNDDGVYAYGILALAKALQAQGGHQIHIVAPDREQSGTAHSFTFLTPLHAEPVRLEGLDQSWAKSGHRHHLFGYGIRSVRRGVIGHSQHGGVPGREHAKAGR